jgi:hypothetical protein
MSNFLLSQWFRVKYIPERMSLLVRLCHVTAPDDGEHGFRSKVSTVSGAR